MGFFAKLFGITKKNDPTSNEFVENLFGGNLFGACASATKSFASDLNKRSENLDLLELTIAIMWTYHRMLNSKEKFEKSLSIMHEHYCEAAKSSGIDSKSAYKLLSARYSEYEKAFVLINNESPTTYLGIAPLVSANAQHLDSPCTRLDLHILINMWLKEHLSYASRM